ncbi:MAG: amidohydrolase family protein, partial [Selenomonadaceae bacterium]
RDMVKKEGIAPEQAVQIVTSNVARVLKLPQKGQVAAGMDADFTIVDEDFRLRHVWARGQHMVADGQVIVRGTFE